jgi:toxin ParE1/3/4
VKTYSVVFTPEAEEQLVELYRYIEENASAEIALGYTGAVVEHCESLGRLPQLKLPLKSCAAMRRRDTR